MARLRAEARRLGIRAVSLRGAEVRFDGWEPPKSQQVRLERVVDGLRVLPDAVVLRLRGGAGRAPTRALLALLAEIAPAA